MTTPDRLNPDQIRQLLLDGQKCADQQAYGAALDKFLACLPYQRGNASLYAAVGECLIHLKRYSEAIQHYRVAVNIEPGYVPAIIGYADALLLAGKYDKALTHLHKSRKHFDTGTEDHGIYLGCLGNAHKALGNLAEAERLFSKGLQQAPHYAGLWTACANLMTQMQEYREAGMCYEKAVELSPSYITYNNLSSHYLNIGRWSDAWKVHEQRLASPFRGFGLNGVPWYAGGHMSGRLAVFSEQGHGDFIHFSRYLEPLKWKVRDLVLVVDERQKTLADRMQLGIPVVDHIERGQFQMQTSLMSLPYVLDLPDPRVAPEPVRFDIRPHRYGYDKPVVALVWFGNPENPNAAIRDCPLRVLAPLVRGAPHLHWMTVLAGEDVQKDIHKLGLPIEQRLGDWVRTAENLAGADLVIGVDTGPLHLAGTLGCESWLMLASFTDWRWSRNLGLEDSPLYRRTRLFRQENGEDWHPVVKRLGAALRERFPARPLSTAAPALT